MATCKSCIGYKYCSRGRNGKTNFYGEISACNNVEILCNDFKPTADVAEVKHGEWELCDDAFGNDAEHHRCSVCKSEAIFECIYQPIYDENYDGEMEYIAEEFAGINEFLTDYCPNCGAKMDGGKHDKV